MSLFNKIRPLRIAARNSPLSQAQVQEFAQEIKCSLEVTFVSSPGDRDKKTSLRELDKTDFFTRDIDLLVLSATVDCGVHSAKDLPEPLPQGLFLACLTRGVDPRDSLVTRDGILKPGMLVATSSQRREGAVREMIPSAQFCDVRGTIGERLALLDAGTVDAVVVAHAALIRLKLLERPFTFLPGATAPFQGQLAGVCRKEDTVTQALLETIDSRVSAS